MKVLITGGNGFIGSYLVQTLLDQHYQVRCLLLEGDQPLRGLEKLPVEIVYGDICKPETLGPAMKGVDYIIHLAAIKNAWDEETYMRINCGGTKNILEAALESNGNLKRFLFVSTQAAAGPSPDGHPLTEDDPARPLSLYGTSKLAAEQYLQSHEPKVPFTILRPSAIYGPFIFNMSITAMMLWITRWRVAPNIHSQGQLMHMLHINDMVRGLVTAMEKEEGLGQTYFITTPRIYNWREVVKIAFDLRGKKGLIFPLPKILIKSGAGIVKATRRLRGKPVTLIDDLITQMLHPYWVCSGEKAKRELGFEATISLEDGLSDTIDWFDHQRA